jgi:hypothetical protein
MLNSHVRVIVERYTDTTCSDARTAATCTILSIALVRRHASALPYRPTLQRRLEQ